MFTGTSRREVTPVLCSVRLSWRHRARPSTTLHEIRPAEADGIHRLYHARFRGAREALFTASHSKGRASESMAKWGKHGVSAKPFKCADIAQPSFASFER